MGKEIYTIGHSTRQLEEFLDLLKHYEIKVLADVRMFPYSRKFPHFNLDNLSEELPKSGIVYTHFPGLGGRRKAIKNSPNTAWRSKSFQAYADYMLTSDFKSALKQLENEAINRRTAVMCSEAVWWRCHRRLISDALVVAGWTVFHILSLNKADKHQLNEAAKFKQGNLDYEG
jgi:uncharacterized protein (DUF488 family)